MQKPSVGRVVHFYKTESDAGANQMQAAVITKVWSDECVNLYIMPADGGSGYGQTSVMFSETPRVYSWCWPPRV